MHYQRNPCVERMINHRRHDKSAYVSFEPESNQRPKDVSQRECQLQSSALPTELSKGQPGPGPRPRRLNTEEPERVRLRITLSMRNGGGGTKAVVGGALFYACAQRPPGSGSLDAVWLPTWGKTPNLCVKTETPPLPLHPSRDCCPFSLLLFLKALLSGVASLSGSVHVPWAPPRVRGSGAGRPDSCVENLINAQLTVLGGGA